MAAKMPFFRSSAARLDTAPTTVGPPEHPRSPASASSANKAVPPFRIDEDALLKVPGHMIPTDRPQIAHPNRDSCGSGDREISRSAIKQKTAIRKCTGRKLHRARCFPA